MEKNNFKKTAALDVVKNQSDMLTLTPDRQIKQWVERTTAMLQKHIIEREVNYFKNTNFDKSDLQLQLLQLQNGLLTQPEYYLLQSEADTSQPPQSTTATHPVQSPVKPSSVKNNNVFIVHGQDELAKAKLARVLEQLKLKAIILHEQVNAGKTIIEKFENNASESAFAVVLLTPDDMGYVQGRPEAVRPRARQNVILELGYFCGALGRSKVCVLYKGDIEIPTDYLGVIYIKMDNDDAWRYQLAKELKQAGLSVDVNNII